MKACYPVNINACAGRKRTDRIIVKPELKEGLIVTTHTENRSAVWHIFRKDEILVKNREKIHFPEDDTPFDLGLEPIRSGEVSSPEGEVIRWAEVSEDTDPPEGMTFAPRRQVLESLGEEGFSSSGKAYHLMDWTRKRLFCGRCGTPMENSTNEIARICPSCGHVEYPLICPAIIVAVEKEGKLLLGRSPRFPRGRYSVLAGFVEPGESLEETVEREVFEEVSIKVDNIQYFGSQPWPFPHSLMIGFTAKWKSGGIDIDGVEIEDAGWYAPHEFPEIPTTRSISGKLINNFLAKFK
jgi:NAD+ diphosphatase